MSNVFEVNFDGLVGPTHNYSGLSHDNLAATSSKGDTSNPKEAALQGLEKMKMLANLGIKQAIIPPQERPLIPLLKKLGFEGSSKDILAKAYKQSPSLLSSAFSAASMWTANSATVTPSSDSLDNTTHITPANLVSELHRSIESDQSFHFFNTVFNNKTLFTVHHPLEKTATLADEGAANHTRLCPNHNSHGLHLFVYGRSSFKKSLPRAKNFIPRQSLEASTSIARTHKIPEGLSLFFQQSPQAIDAGVFHNDVIAVGNENLFLCHEHAFVNQKESLDILTKTFQAQFQQELDIIEIPNRTISLQDAVESYLFNSQLITLSDNTMLFVAPSDCEAHSNVKKFLEELPTRYPKIQQISTIDLKQSMKNGGGPACLRLRIILNKSEIASISNNIFINDTLYSQLKAWINKHYRSSISPKDLIDPKLIEESKSALDELTQILKLKNLYSFQR